MSGLDAEGRDYLARMQNAAVRMQALIQALLNYSRVTTKAQPFSLTDLASVAREVVSDLEARMTETGGRVEIGDLPQIEADPTQMRQLIQNLVGNALKFHGEEKPVVKIYGQPVRSDGRYQIFVEDNGIGFDEKYLDRIFTPFQRLHGRGTYEGTGIGLAICRKIVRPPWRKHHGQERTREGNDLYRDAARETTEGRNISERQQDKSITILMADDDQDDCLLVSKAFEASRLANDLRFVADGEELMDYLHQSG